MQLQTSVPPTYTRPVCAFACGQPRSFRQQNRLQALQLSSTLNSKPRRGRPCVAPRAAAVETDDKFRLTHSVSTNTFEVKGDLEKVFTYAADFSHISGWDSGTTGSKLRESDSRPAFKKGDTVALMTVLWGVKSSTLYQLLEIDSPKKVVFFGISRFHESTDTVTFNRKAGQNDVVEVEYTTDIELVRWYKWFQPFLGFVMANLAKEAVEGMQKKLQGMVQQGKLQPEKATASA